MPEKRQCIRRAGAKKVRCKLKATYWVAGMEVCFRHLPWAIKTLGGKGDQVPVNILK
jgi:hypothetical protein